MDVDNDDQDRDQEAAEAEEFPACVHEGVELGVGMLVTRVPLTPSSMSTKQAVNVCQLLCQQDTRCAAFSLSMADGVCDLKTSLAPSRQDAKWVSGRRSCWEGSPKAPSHMTTGPPSSSDAGLLIRIDQPADAGATTPPAGGAAGDEEGSGEATTPPPAAVATREDDIMEDYMVLEDFDYDDAPAPVRPLRDDDDSKHTESLNSTAGAGAEAQREQENQAVTGKDDRRQEGGKNGGQRQGQQQHAANRTHNPSAPAAAAADKQDPDGGKEQDPLARACFDIGKGYKTSRPASHIGLKEGVRSPKECQKLCQWMPACEAFSYLSVRQTCYFKSEVGTPVNNPDLVSGRKYCKAPAAPHGQTRRQQKEQERRKPRAEEQQQQVSGECVERGKEYGVALGDNRPNLGRLANIKDVNMCARACEEMPPCRFFSYMPESKMCFLKSDKEPVRENDDLVSGSLECQHPGGKMKSYGRAEGTEVSFPSITHRYEADGGSVTLRGVQAGAPSGVHLSSLFTIADGEPPLRYVLHPEAITPALPTGFELSLASLGSGANSSTTMQNETVRTAPPYRPGYLSFSSVFVPSDEPSPPSGRRSLLAMIRQPGEWAALPANSHRRRMAPAVGGVGGSVADEQVLLLTCRGDAGTADVDMKSALGVEDSFGSQTLLNTKTIFYLECV